MANSIYLKPGETIVYKAGGLKKVAESFFFVFLKILIGLGTVLAIAYLLLVSVNLLKLDNVILGWSMILISLGIFSLSFNYYYKGYLLHSDEADLAKTKSLITEGKPVNIWSCFSIELSGRLAGRGLNFSKPVNSRDIFLAIIDSREVQELFVRLAMPKNEMVEIIKTSDKGNMDVEKIFSKALDIAIAENHRAIELGDLFLSLCLYDPVLKNLIFQLKIEPSDIANVILWQTKNRIHFEKRRHFLDPDNLTLTGGIGRDWAYGYTVTLEQYSKDLSETVKMGGFDSLQLEAKDREIAQIEETLTRAENHNVVVVGDPGVGKKTTVYGLAKKIFQGKSTSVLSNRRMLEVDIEAVLAGVGDPSQVISRIQAIFGEAAYAGNIILFIDNISNIVATDNKVGRINALEALLPFLEMPNIFIIGTVDQKDFRNYFAPNQLLMTHFVKVDLHEPNFDETIRIIEDVLPQIEGRNGVVVCYEAIKEAVKLTDKFMQNLPQPQKTIDLIDQVATKKASEGGGLVMPGDIDAVVKNITNVPVGEIESNEKQILLKLEDEMHQKIVGQTEAVTAIANALRRARAGVVDSKKPVGSFLFLGPTGVGKTETAKTLAAQYFGSEEAMIRFDMSEYQQKSDIYRLIGDPEDENSQGLLTSQVREKPFSLLLFDEVEKADPDILNLFLQILDEGNITDSQGVKCSFQSAIIILTSNAGSEFIRQASRQKIVYEELQKGLINFVQQENFFRPEFLNRFTQVIVFRPLTLEEIIKVAEFMIKKLVEHLVAERGVFVTVTPEAIRKLAELGFDPEMGARPMQRSIQEHLENVLAKKLLSGEINRGDKLTIDILDLEI